MLLGRLVVVASCVAAAACYSPPEPDCGFACGPNNACPADYTCAADRHCHRNGTPAGLVCAAPDAGVDGPAAPRVLATEPSDHMTGVAVDVVPTAVIDQAVTGVDDTSVTMTGSGGTAVAGHADAPTGTMAIRFRPTLQLPGNVTYTVSISAAVLGSTGVPLGPYSWSFTTGADVVPPHVVFVDPAPGATGVGAGTAISIDFDEVVMGVDTTSFTITDGVTPVAGAISTTGGHSYVFTPATALAATTAYTVDLSTAIHDAAGNALVDYSFMFTTQ